MRSVTMTQALRTGTSFATHVGVALLMTAAACGNHRGSEQTPPPTCVDSCQPDLGSRTMTQQDCDDAESGIEFLPLPIWDMGPVTDSTGYTRNIATAMYFYDDMTAIFRAPGKIWEPSTEVAYSGVPPQPIVNGVVNAGWIPPDNYEQVTKDWAVQPPQQKAVGRCGEPLPDPNDPIATNQTHSPNVHYALHIAGGPFLEWGGGMGRMLKCMNTDSTTAPWLPELNLNKYLCAARQSTTFVYPDPTLAACSQDGDTPEAQLMQSVCPARDVYYKKNNQADPNDEPYMTGMSLDMSQWEGISFWARRSPNSQEGIRLAVADKYVDDDMSYLSMKYNVAHPGYNDQHPRYCERKVVCGCLNNKPCTAVQVTDNTFDVDGNRVKWSATDSSGNVRGPLALDYIDPTDTPDNIHGHSLIDMSGDPVTGANGQPVTMPDGSTVREYQGPTGTTITGQGYSSGQPFDSDYMPNTRTEYFCFDSAVDPTPPPGTPLSQIINRGYQNLRITASDPYLYLQDPVGGFYINTAAPGIIDQIDSTPANLVQLPVTDRNHAEQPGYFYQPCGPSYCKFEYPSFQAVDPQAYGRSCNPFPFKGSITYSYCFDPGQDPNPPEASLQCGDFWMKPVALGTDWQFIKVPFTSLLQQGWAKRFYKLDLSSLTDVRLEWDRGWIDIWISDVRFYRTKQQ